MTLKEQLINGKARLGVWGCGYIGFTTMINFAKEGVYVTGYDVKSEIIESIKNGQNHIPNLDFWIGYHIGELVNRMVKATSDWQDMMAEDIKVHLIAIPTEKGGEPWSEPLKDVMDKIAQRKPTAENPDLIIIESTLTPGTFDKIVMGTLGERAGKEFLVGIAPRRDWFDSPEKNLQSLARVIGGTTEETTKIMGDVLGIVCNKLIHSDAGTVELVKSVENSIFHICATYACQLANAYPDRDIAEVLKLASTHWRIPLYFPSVGTGGYCIPVSSKYVRDGATKPESLGLTREAISSDTMQPVRIANMMNRKIGFGKSVGILGISYKRDLKVHVLSPALKIIAQLKNIGVEVKAYDPYYSPMEMYQICGIKSFKYPEDLAEFGGLIIVPPHRIFSQTPKDMLFKYLKEGQQILDNEGIWSKWKSDFITHTINYHRVGDKNWME